MISWLFYIIIRPVAVDEEVPNHDDANRKGKSGILGKYLGSCVGEMRHILERTRHDRLHEMKDGNSESNPDQVHQKEHT